MWHIQGPLHEIRLTVAYPVTMDSHRADRLLTLLNTLPEEALIVVACQLTVTDARNLAALNHTWADAEFATRATAGTLRRHLLSRCQFPDDAVRVGPGRTPLHVHQVRTMIRRSCRGPLRSCRTHLARHRQGLAVCSAHATRYVGLQGTMEPVCLGCRGLMLADDSRPRRRPGLGASAEGLRAD